MSENISDALMQLVPEIELPDGYPTLRTGDPDRLGALADWWALVSSAPAPAQVTLAWSDVPAPDTAPGILAKLAAADGAVPTGVAEAIAWGAEQADRAVDGGADLIVLTIAPEPPGSASSAGRTEALGDAELAAHVLLAAHLLQLDAVEATPWPSEDGLSDGAWAARVASLRDGRQRIRGIYGEPQRLLETLDVNRIAAGAGLLARATARRTPTLLDGSAAAACGLLVRRAEPAARAWWQAADGGDVVHERVLRELRLSSILQLGLETRRRPYPAGVGGRLGLSVLETALRTVPARD